MQRLVEQYGLGVTTAGFTVSETVKALALLDADRIRRFKVASNQAARTLSFETDADVVRSLVRQALAGAAT
jgi:hypothetical protein